MTVFFMRILTGLLLTVGAAGASSDKLSRALDLYEQTEYVESLHVLNPLLNPALTKDPSERAAVCLLAGKNYFMLGDQKKAIEFFEKALATSPSSSEYHLWLGRAWGRRAETSGWLTAPMHASKARQYLEKAVALDSKNREAKNDLFDYYLNAPAVLGGGLDKAEAIARSIARERPPEYEFEEAELADHKKDYSAEETHLRRAMELAPAEPGRVIDLARYEAKRGRFDESDQLFDKARKLAPGQPRVAFAEARADIENRRNLSQARRLLQSYVHSKLTPDDPPRQEAEKLLRRTSG